jgi:hypothetical protein
MPFGFLLVSDLNLLLFSQGGNQNDHKNAAEANAHERNRNFTRAKFALGPGAVGFAAL